MHKASISIALQMSFYPGQIGENNSSIIFADWSYFLCSIFLDLQQCLPNNSSLFWHYLYEEITILFGMYVWIVVMAGCEAPTCLHNQPTNQTHINTNLSILVRMNYGTLIKTHLKNDLLLNAFLCFENHHVAPMENICEYCVNIGSRAICGLFLWCCATLVFPVIFFSDDKFRKFRLPFYSLNAANHDSSQIQAPFSSNNAHFQEF